MTQTNPEPTSLHALNPLTRFSDRAGDYVKSRPSYPSAAIDFILSGLSPSLQLVAADIGAGTGISSRLLAERGVRVIGIEPNMAMREAAELSPSVEFRDGTAEATHLPDASVDLVTCFQAFHWFKPEPTLSEFRRILKSSGLLALVWNNPDEDDEFTAQYSRLIREASNNPSSESRIKSLEPLFATTHFIDVRSSTFVNSQKLDLTGLISRAMSSSHIPREGVAQQQLIESLQDLYQGECDRLGFVYLAYCTSVHLAYPAL
ncbi:MAG: methyltransferase domain-containing protein [Rhizonema sp. PD38]|nr:methyltransferase domain-containing protein [Rhizonema sp. PD38]